MLLLHVVMLAFIARSALAVPPLRTEAQADGAVVADSNEDIKAELIEDDLSTVLSQLEEAHAHAASADDKTESEALVAMTDVYRGARGFCALVLSILQDRRSGQRVNLRQRRPDAGEMLMHSSHLCTHMALVADRKMPAATVPARGPFDLFVDAAESFCSLVEQAAGIKDKRRPADAQTMKYAGQVCQHVRHGSGKPEIAAAAPVAEDALIKLQADKAHKKPNDMKEQPKEAKTKAAGVEPVAEAALIKLPAGKVREQAEDTEEPPKEAKMKAASVKHVAEAPLIRMPASKVHENPERIEEPHKEEKAKPKEQVERKTDMPQTHTEKKEESKKTDLKSKDEDTLKETNKEEKESAQKKQEKPAAATAEEGAEKEKNPSTVTQHTSQTHVRDLLVAASKFCKQVEARVLGHVKKRSVAAGPVHDGDYPKVRTFLHAASVCGDFRSLHLVPAEQSPGSARPAGKDTDVKPATTADIVDDLKDFCGPLKALLSHRTSDEKHHHQELVPFVIKASSLCEPFMLQ